jgi:hypothetical protein
LRSGDSGGTRMATHEDLLGERRLTGKKSVPLSKHEGCVTAFVGRECTSVTPSLQTPNSQRRAIPTNRATNRPREPATSAPMPTKFSTHVDPHRHQC